jgi:hypothetical protein
MSELFINEFSLHPGNGGGFAQKVDFTSVSAQSAKIDAKSALIFTTTPGFVRAGADPVALADGTDPYLSVGIHYRVRFPRNSKLAFISDSGSGSAFITPIT